jgi:hypothetical protein
MGRVAREGQGPVAQHRLTSRRTRASLRHTVDMMDLRTGTIHLLSSAAAAAGTNRTGRYVALCGADIIRADDLTDPGFRHYCWSCRSVIPRQRSGS